MIKNLTLWTKHFLSCLGNIGIRNPSHRMGNPSPSVKITIVRTKTSHFKNTLSIIWTWVYFLKSSVLTKKPFCWTHQSSVCLPPPQQCNVFSYVCLSCYKHTGHLVVKTWLQPYSQSRRPHGSRPFHDFDWYNSCGTEKCPLAANGSRRQERPPEVVLYGGRPYGGFVNSAVRRCHLFMSTPLVIPVCY